MKSKLLEERIEQIKRNIERRSEVISYQRNQIERAEEDIKQANNAIEEETDKIAFEMQLRDMLEEEFNKQARYIIVQDNKLVEVGLEEMKKHMQGLTETVARILYGEDMTPPYADEERKGFLDAQN